MFAVTDAARQGLEILDRAWSGRVALRRRPVALACLVAAGCGGVEEKRPLAPPVTDAERVAGTVREQAAALATGDGRRACERFSPAVVAEIDRMLARRAPNLRPVCADALAELASRLSKETVAQLRRPRISSVTVEGDTAVVTVVPPPELRELAQRFGRADAVGGRIPLRKIGGVWKVDALKL